MPFGLPRFFLRITMKCVLRGERNTKRYFDLVCFAACWR